MAVFVNPKPKKVFTKLDDLTTSMTLLNPHASDYINYLLEGDIKQGKGFWKTKAPKSIEIYNQFLKQNTNLKTESPFIKKVQPTSNVVVITSYTQLTIEEQKQVNQFLTSNKNQAVFAGGPAAKIATVILSLKSKPKQNVAFIIDSAKRSNESSSASYAHINHANALNAQWASTGLGILPTLVKRNFFKAENVNEALNVKYKSVDLWLKNITFLDFILFIKNIIHGFKQQFKKGIGIQNEHDKSRLASLKSSLILDWIEHKTNILLRFKNAKDNAFFINVGLKAHQHAIKENAYLAKSIGLSSYQLNAKELHYFYSAKTAENITSVNVFPQNGCFVHGFDKTIKKISAKTGFSYLEDKQISHVYIKNNKAVAIKIKNLTTLSEDVLPVSSLGLSLGPKVNYKYDGFSNKVKPVPYQTLATGVSCQVLFKITNKESYTGLPYTGLHQAHFVEMASNTDYVLVKLTSGGNIADTKYSRSYPINALADMLRVITPECGLTFYDVICAWPCSRGINASNNGELVRITDNFVIRFGEGGTGMSKMASNAQVMLDMLNLKHGLTGDKLLARRDYQHTIIDNRKKTAKCLF